jgi:DUF4097 and DUF4098 domain-containing protein YvlB
MGALMPTFATPEPISARVELSLGHVHLIASPRADTVVVVNPTDRSRPADVEAAEKASVQFSNGTLQISVPKPRVLSSLIGPTSKTGSVDVTIELPEGSDLEAEADLGDFRTDGRLGDTRIKAGAGDIAVDQAGGLTLASGAGRVDVGRSVGHTEVTSAGDMHLREIDGDAQIKNLNGKTWVGEVTGPIRVKSANGDIVVDKAHAEIAAKTANGNIEIGEVVTGSVVLGTASGHVEVAIRKGTAAWVDASTQFGRVHNSLGAAGGPEPSEQTVEIQARTHFGDIVIRRFTET